MTKVILVQMPFQSVRRPSLGLSLLREVLEQDGHTVELSYLNIEFARRIGWHLFSTISEKMSPEHLFGDLVFAPTWLNPLPSGHEPSQAEISSYAATQPIPHWLVEVVPALVSEARELVRTESRAIATGGFDLVGLSTTFNLTPSLAMAHQLKADLPAITTVLGGASCEAAMGTAIIRHFAYVDYVCQGEGEQALLGLARAVAAGEQGKRRLPGLLSRQYQGIARTAAPQNLDALPVPRYGDWLRQLDNAKLGICQDDLQIPIETSRGCWYGAQQHCTFCGLNGENLRYRSKSPDAVLREIDAALAYGVINIHAVDNILDFRYFRTVLPDLARLGHKARLFYEIKSKITRDQMVLMRQAGIRTVQPGIESLSTTVLALMRKGVQAYHNIRLLKWAEELGIAATWNMLYGFPRERAQDYDEMIALLPWLFHLQPPSEDRVRMDRFSPLHYDGPALGVASRRSAAAYRHVYGLPEAELEQLAYYFEFEADGSGDPEDYAPRLRAAIQDWQTCYPHSALVRAETANGCHVFDTRSTARLARRLLSPTELDLVRRCDRGARPAELLAGAADRPAAEKAVAELTDLGWLVAIDGRLLSVIVDYTPMVPASLPDGLLEDYCLERVTVRHRVLSTASEPDRADEADAQSLRARWRR
jgi:ribosomal peptide maturation radical SAM protein 1